MFSLALTSHEFPCCRVTSGLGPAGTCSGACRASIWLSWELRPTLLSVKIVSAACPACGTLNTRGTLPIPVRDNFLHSKSVTAPAFSKKSVPSRPAASTGRAHTRNARVNSRPFSVRVTDYSLYIQDFPNHTIWSCRCDAYVTPRHVGLQNRDIGACVDNQTSWHPFYFNPNSGSALLQYDRNHWFHGSIFRGVGLPSFTPFTRFPEFSLSLWLPDLLLGVTFSPGNANASNVRSDYLFQVCEGLWFFLRLVGHSLAKCPSPSHS